ncbi:hypothetical protein [Duganella sp. Dugasp56]|uniref:hypothetical protein n=1 Tax=Duganella sp. Dugasp56 TaxID=3243046 RepID=UPI0039AF038D
MPILSQRGFAIVVASALLAWSASAASAVYYVDNAGVDSNDGSLSTPWKTLYKVSTAALAPGDTVLFKRGGQWRDYNLVAKTGQIGSPITYGAYGSGNKPRLLGSVSLASESDWKETSLGSSIWVSQVAEPGNPSSSNQLSNPDFALPGTWLTSIAGAMAAVTRSTAEYLPPVPPKTDTASMKIDFTGVTGNEATSDIQVYTLVGGIVAGRCYHFSFNAKASAIVALKSEIKLFQNTSPYMSYATSLRGALPVIGTNWANYDVYFRATSTQSDGRLDLMLGKAATLGTTLYIDNVNFRECNIEKYITADVGNVIFDSAQAIVGTKVLSEAELNQDGKFWYDAANNQLKLYSTGNPALVLAHGELEAAVNRPGLDIKGVTDVAVSDLDIRNTGGHGAQVTYVKRITLDGLAISYAGGSVKSDGHTRYGNGIEVYEAAQAVSVTNSTFSQIYDVAMTSQGMQNSIVADITFNNNLARQAEQCFELWNRYAAGPNPSSTTSLAFTHNTCVGSGTGWSHTQRATQEGADVLLYTATGGMSGIRITDNIFYNATTAVVRLGLPWTDYMQIDFGNNCYMPMANSANNLGLLLKETGGPSNLFLKTSSQFNTAFGTNTASSQFVDPQLSIDLMPTAAACSGKGYASPSSI